jgi:hypothetical protein
MSEPSGCCRGSGGAGEICNTELRAGASAPALVCHSNASWIGVSLQVYASFEDVMAHWCREHFVEVSLATAAVVIPLLIIYFVLFQ